jgi:hypothetical protein
MLSIKSRPISKRQIHAVNLYLGALKGELPNAEPAPAPKPELKPHRTPSGPRAPRGERRSALLDILKQTSDGYTFDRIKEIMGVTDEREKKAVYSALQNMKRSGDVVQNANKQFVVLESQADEGVGSEQIAR